MQITSEGVKQMVTVIHDPSGDFSPGAQFTSLDLALTHVVGYWPLGIRFRLHNGKLARVVGALMVREDGYVLDVRDKAGTYRWREL